jgi:hypothetical protein
MLDISQFFPPASQIRILIRLLNGLFTVSFFPFLYRLYNKNNKRFYLLWGTGFLFYGINILIRAIVDSVEAVADPIQWVAFVFYMTGFILIITGIGDLIEQTRVALLSSLLLHIVPVITYFVASPETIGWTVTLSPFLLISISLIFIRRKYSASLDLFIIGWLFLLGVNIAVPLNMMDQIFVELFAICGKIVIFQGMTSPKFSYLADEIKRYLLSGSPKEYPSLIKDHIFLVKIVKNTREQELDWIKEKVEQNVREGVRTIFIALYDLITLSELRVGGVDEEELYFVRMFPVKELRTQIIEDNTAVMSDHISQLDLLVSEIIKFSEDRKIRCDIILYTLSWVIHTHGWEEVYKLFIARIPELKESNVQLYNVYYPETHNLEEISKFEMLADHIINLV